MYRAGWIGELICCTFLLYRRPSARFEVICIHAIVERTNQPLILSKSHNGLGVLLVARSQERAQAQLRPLFVALRCLIQPSGVCLGAPLRSCGLNRQQQPSII